MTVRNLRREKGWSQEQLAQFSGLSVRTVQRIERGQKAGLESLKCLAAVFETDVSNLNQEQPMADNNYSFRSDADQAAIDYYKFKDVMLHTVTFSIFLPSLYLLNVNQTPEDLWIKEIALFWGAGLILHGMMKVILFGPSNRRE